MPRPRKGQLTNTDSPLKRLRETAGLSQQELAHRMNVAVSSISRWERGTTEPTMTLAQVKALCNALDKTLDEMPDSLIAKVDE